MSKNLDRDFSLKEWVTNRAANSPEAMEDETVLRVQTSRELRMQAENIKAEMNENTSSEESHPKVTARITNTAAPAPIASPAQQIQIVRLLRDLGDRLKTSEKEREILWRELDSCRKLLTDIEDKTNNTEKAFLSIEHKMNSLPENNQEESKDFQKQIEDKIAALETTTGSAVIRLEDAIAENAKLARRLEEVTQDRTLLLRKMEEMEETLTQTQDTLKAKALVLLTDQALAARTALPQTPAWSGNDTLRTQESAGVNTKTAETILAVNKPWWKTTTKFNMNTGLVAALIALGVIGGWALSKSDIGFPFAKTETFAPVDLGAALHSGEQQSEVTDPAMSGAAQMANAIEPGQTAPADATPSPESQALSLEKSAIESFNAFKEGGALKDRIDADDKLPSVVKAIENKAFAGNVDAKHDLAAIYTAGHAGVKADYEKAAEWFTEAAHGGVANAQYNLAVLYHQGLGVQQDTKKAIELYRVAANGNHPEAQYNLGIAHIEGIGADYNPEIAAYYFRKAATGGVVEAAYNMGLIEENGLLGEAQPEQAVFWYKLAAKNGNTQAADALAQLTKQLEMSAAQADKIFSRIHAENPQYLKNVKKGDDAAAPVKAEAKAAPVAAAAPVPVAAPKFDPVIVAQIQEQLIRLGLFSGSPDGTVNDATQDAVRSYQSMNKIKSDGRPTEDVLVHMLASEMQAPAAGATE